MVGISEGLLGGIANPAQADVSGGFQRGQATREKREGNELTADILKNTVGTKIADLIKLDSGRGLDLVKAMGIPLNEKDRIKNVFGNIVAANQMLQVGTDPREVAQFLAEQASQLETGGISTQLTQNAIKRLTSGNPDEIMQQVDSFNEMTQRILGPKKAAKTNAQIERDVLLGEDKLKLERDKFNQAKLEFSADSGSSQDPSALVAGLPSRIADQATEAFKLAGGGDKGVKALQAAIKTGREQVQREEIPELLSASFPNASPAEREQLSAAAASGKTPESGLKAAEKVRSEQRRLKKAKGFQSRALDLMKGIVSNPQLGDVLGSIEGSYDTRLFSDAEAELIADIREVGDIMTADNMDLMTGVLSESDIQLLKNLSSGGLNRTRSEKRFLSDVNDMITRLSSQIVKTADDEEKITVDKLSDEELFKK